MTSLKAPGKKFQQKEELFTLNIHKIVSIHLSPSNEKEEKNNSLVHTDRLSDTHFKCKCNVLLSERSLRHTITYYTVNKRIQKKKQKKIHKYTLQTLRLLNHSHFGIFSTNEDGGLGEGSDELTYYINPSKNNRFFFFSTQQL